MTIGLVGKYVQLHDAYLSVAEALRHAGYALGAEVDIQWIDSETLTEANCRREVWASWTASSSPAASASRGIEGMILAATVRPGAQGPLFRHLPWYADRRHRIRPPCRRDLPDANSGEFDELCEHKVIDFMPGQSDEIDKGGTLRLGAYPCVIQPGTTMARCYGARTISERHRHRYEFNNDYRDALHRRGADPLRHCPRTGGWWRPWS